MFKEAAGPDTSGMPQRETNMKDWQIFFWAAAFFNFAIGAPLFISPETMVAMTGTVGTVDPALMKVTGALVLCFGVVYAIVGGDPVRYRPVVWAGLLGKLGVAYVYLPDWYQGTIPFTTTLIVLMDMGFIVAFLYFLLRPTQKKSGFQANRAVSS
ncbi:MULTISPECIES: hypothetical protein [Hyphomonas]|uniref:hypothetical protein n=1 Tax=Hyphomonas TaxID=85 RepID=UPI000C3F44D8|nr:MULTISPECIES: hypothetical protein [Hyphomonas]MBB39609.1 hypothetical protein [Hyphomonas sp.]|tara:strand:+ start:9335 stop:9799 length:465 start_codon:yes stop_codon:yes gene_type:complete